ncbi:MAG: sulfatase [Planctomycetes bacterium]|nr:sulfatase [Planctomycetota bacterium]
MGETRTGGKWTRRRFLATTAGAAIGAAGLSCATRGTPAAPRAPARRPNIVFFFADQLRAQALGCEGETNIATPNIDRLAREGAWFTNALSTCPLCTPFRGMVQTGRYPTHSGLVMNWVDMHPSEVGIAEVFGAAGYDTGFIGKWHLAAGRLRHVGLTPPAKVPPPRDPEPEYVPPGEARAGYRHWEAFNFHANFAHAFYYRDTPERLIMPRYETDAETDMAISFIRSHAGGEKPFFLMVAPHPPHPPWKPDQTPEGALDRVRADLAWRSNVEGVAARPNDDPRCYYAMIANVDDNVGRLLACLEETGLARDTIVVFTADHGEMLWSHGRRNKMVFFEEAIRVPLAIRWPGVIPAGVRSDALYAPIDHMATLASLAGIAAPATCDGEDMSPAARGEAFAGREAALLANYVANWDYCVSAMDAKSGGAARWPEWRGLRTRRHTYARWLADGREELYDNAADPFQERDIAGDPAVRGIRDEMRERLRALLADAHDDVRPGSSYVEWFTEDRRIARSGLGPKPA